MDKKDQSLKKPTLEGVLLSLFFVLLFIYALVISSSYPYWARLVPQVILIISIILSLGNVIVYFKGFFPIKREKGKEKTLLSLVSTIFRTPLLYIFVIAILYPLVLRSLGYILTTMTFTLCCMFLLGVRKDKYLIILPILSTIGFYYLFRYANVAFPRGLLGF